MGHTPWGDRTSHAFITGPNGIGMTDLGTLGGTGSIATDINDIGQVVGFALTAEGESHAFVTGPNGVGMIGLNPLMSELGVLPPWQYVGIWINNNGQILVTPIPEPGIYAMLLAGLSLIGFIAGRRRAA